eukprot:m.280173 g.280173  ORF g.280173 m.280173 type:complete len:78 (+) comp26974_c0_seq34:3400-3633(+)
MLVENVRSGITCGEFMTIFASDQWGLGVSNVQASTIGRNETLRYTCVAQPNDGLYLTLHLLRWLHRQPARTEHDPGG